MGEILVGAAVVLALFALAALIASAGPSRRPLPKYPDYTWKSKTKTKTTRTYAGDDSMPGDWGGGSDSSCDSGGGGDGGCGGGD